MGYYHDPQNVKDYLKMAEGYDGKILIEALQPYLPPNSTLLEIGMGGGKDLLLLNEHYQVTGSDYSQSFLDLFQQHHPDIPILQLDAITLQTNQTYDAIYSNKVLYHLTPTELKQSFQLQAKILNHNGILLHSFWFGDKQEEMHGLHFSYYTEDTIQALIDDSYEILKLERYTEMETNDSLYIIVKKK